MRRNFNLKRWFNKKYPFLCVEPWCFRDQVYDHMCHKHNFKYFENME